jgi:Flp pilus assembly pilin Flp
MYPRSIEMYARYLALKSKLESTDKGASMVEYALLVILIAIVAFVAVQVAGVAVSSTYVDIANSFDT